MAFDDLGQEYMIDMVDSPGEIGDLAQTGATERGFPTFRTREGHAVDYLGDGKFAVTVPGRDEPVTVRRIDPTSA
jgi:hypothetical protein